MSWFCYRCDRELARDSAEPELCEVCQVIAERDEVADEIKRLRADRDCLRVERDCLQGEVASIQKYKHRFRKERDEARARVRHLEGLIRDRIAAREIMDDWPGEHPGAHPWVHNEGFDDE